MITAAQIRVGAAEEKAQSECADNQFDDSGGARKGLCRNEGWKNSRLRADPDAELSR
jgi:hypothetical protein